MTESEALWYFQIAAGLGLFCIGFVGGSGWSWFRARRQELSEIDQDGKLFRQIYPR